MIELTVGAIVVLLLLLFTLFSIVVIWRVNRYFATQPTKTRNKSHA